MKKIKGILIKSGVLLVLFAVVLAIWLWSNQDSYSEFVVYEHDKLFHKFMENHEFEGTPIGEESVEVVSASGKIKIRYSSDQFMRIECESGYNGFSPKIYGVDKNGNFVCDFALCDGLNGYYDPYSKRFWTEFGLLNRPQISSCSMFFCFSRFSEPIQLLTSQVS